MALFMVEILELVLTFVTVWIYGTDDKPRHPIWRNSVRIVAFTGAFVSAASLLSILGNFEVPRVATLIWALCSLIVISAEYYVGSKKVFLAAVIVFATWLAISLEIVVL
jgi:hypothetical protein